MPVSFLTVTVSDAVDVEIEWNRPAREVSVYTSHDEFAEPISLTPGTLVSFPQTKPSSPTKRKPDPAPSKPSLLTPRLCSLDAKETVADGEAVEYHHFDSFRGTLKLPQGSYLMRFILFV